MVLRSALGVLREESNMMEAGVIAPAQLDTPIVMLVGRLTASHAKVQNVKLLQFSQKQCFCL